MLTTLYRLSRRTSLLVACLGCALLTPSVEAQGDEAAVRQIRAQFAVINIGLKRDVRISRSMDSLGLNSGSTEGGLVEAFFDRSSVRKIVATHLGETGKLVDEFYYWDGQPFFVFRVYSYYARPYGAVVRTSEERFYFRDGLLIRYLDPHKREMAVADSAVHSRSTAMLQNAVILRNRMIREFTRQAGFKQSDATPSATDVHEGSASGADSVTSRTRRLVPWLVTFIVLAMSIIIVGAHRLLRSREIRSLSAVTRRRAFLLLSGVGLAVFAIVILSTHSFLGAPQVAANAENSDVGEGDAGTSDQASGNRPANASEDDGVEGTSALTSFIVGGWHGTMTIGSTRFAFWVDIHPDSTLELYVSDPAFASTFHHPTTHALVENQTWTIRSGKGGTFLVGVYKAPSGDSTFSAFRVAPPQLFFLANSGQELVQLDRQGTSTLGGQEPRGTVDSDASSPLVGSYALDSRGANVIYPGDRLIMFADGRVVLQMQFEPDGELRWEATDDSHRANLYITLPYDRERRCGEAVLTGRVLNFRCGNVVLLGQQE